MCRLNHKAYILKGFMYFNLHQGSLSLSDPDLDFLQNFPTKSCSPSREQKDWQDSGGSEISVITNHFGSRGRSLYNYSRSRYLSTPSDFLDRISRGLNK